MTTKNVESGPHDQILSKVSIEVSFIVGQQPIHFEVLAEIQPPWRVEAGIALSAGVNARHDPVPEANLLSPAVPADI